MRDALALEGGAAGRHRVRRLMGLMRLQAIYQKPNTSQPHPEHRIYSYKLRGMNITSPNHVWCTDITYIPMQRGFRSLCLEPMAARSPSRCYGLGDTAGAVLAIIKYARYSVLHGGFG